jgi:hypothetical protein
LRRRIIDEREAKLFSTRIIFNSQWMIVTIKAGDKACRTCFSSLADFKRTCLNTETALVETPEAKNPELSSLEEQLKRESAKEELNRVFTILKMEKIRDE